MPRRAVPLVAGQHYHIYNRGHNKQVIFFEKDNYLFFLQRLRKHIAPAASIVAYCLMPNHYHLLLQPHNDQLSHQMQTFSISYTKALNERYHRVGALFQGAFQAKLVERDEYLVHLSRYIHLNPVRAALVVQPEDWPYSSYCSYVDQQKDTLLKPDVVIAQFPTRQAYQEFVVSVVPSGQPMMEHLLFDEDD